MAKKLLVKVPVTKDGRNLAYNAEKQPIFTEHIVELAAKPHYVALNAKLPSELRYILEEVDEEAGKTADATVLVNTELLKKEEELKAKEVDLQTKDQEVEKLKAELAEAQKKAADAEAQKEAAEKKAADAEAAAQKKAAEHSTETAKTDEKKTGK